MSDTLSWRHIGAVTRTRPAPMAIFVVPVVRECAVVRWPAQAAGRRRGALHDREEFSVQGDSKVFAIMENPGLQIQAHSPSRSRSLRPGLTSSMMLIKLAS